MLVTVGLAGGAVAYFMMNKSKHEREIKKDTQMRLDTAHQAQGHATQGQHVDNEGKPRSPSFRERQASGTDLGGTSSPTPTANAV